MKIEITCPQRWFEAQDLSRKLNDHSLNDCIARCISYATSKDWEVDAAEKKYLEWQERWHRSDQIFEKFKDSDDYSLRDRAYTIKWKMFDKYSAAIDNYFDQRAGGNRTLHIRKDYDAFSFYWWITDDKTDKVTFNGGIIFSDYSKKWSIHT